MKTSPARSIRSQVARGLAWGLGGLLGVPLVLVTFVYGVAVLANVGDESLSAQSQRLLQPYMPTEDAGNGYWHLRGLLAPLGVDSVALGRKRVQAQFAWLDANPAHALGMQESTVERLAAAGMPKDSLTEQVLAEFFARRPSCGRSAGVACLADWAAASRQIAKAAQAHPELAQRMQVAWRQPRFEAAMHAGLAHIEDTTAQYAVAGMHLAQAAALFEQGSHAGALDAMVQARAVLLRWASASRHMAQRQAVPLHDWAQLLTSMAAGADETTLSMLQWQALLAPLPADARDLRLPALGWQANMVLVAQHMDSANRANPSPERNLAVRAADWLSVPLMRPNETTNRIAEAFADARVETDLKDPVAALLKPTPQPAPTAASHRLAWLRNAPGKILIGAAEYSAEHRQRWAQVQVLDELRALELAQLAYAMKRQALPADQRGAWLTAQVRGASAGHTVQADVNGFSSTRVNLKNPPYANRSRMVVQL